MIVLTDGFIRYFLRRIKWQNEALVKARRFGGGGGVDWHI